MRTLGFISHTLGFVLPSHLANKTEKPGAGLKNTDSELDYLGSTSGPTHSGWNNSGELLTLSYHSSLSCTMEVIIRLPCRATLKIIRDDVLKKLGQGLAYSKSSKSKS